MLKHGIKRDFIYEMSIESTPENYAVVQEVIHYKGRGEYGNRHNVTEILLLYYILSLRPSVSLTHSSVQAAACDAPHSSGMSRTLNLNS